ncbi:MAG: hypothetical protein ABSE70_07340 [Candidatus Limnocylindrales bacterium]
MPSGRRAASGAGGIAQPRWRGTIAVAVIVAGVVLGGVAADKALPEPSAGRVAISQPVYMTAAPGWVATTAAGDIVDGVALQKSTALLIAQVLNANYDGDTRRLLTASEASFERDAAQISFGDEREVDLDGKHASAVTFSALFSDAGGSGVVDGELVCLVLHSGSHDYAILIQAGMPQGDLASVADDIDAMAASVEVSQ